MLSFLVVLTTLADPAELRLHSTYRYPVTNTTELLEGKLLSTAPDEFRRLLTLPRETTEVEPDLPYEFKDKSMAEEAVKRLRAAKDAGKLKDFDVNLNVEKGELWLSGRVASLEQRDFV